MQREERPLFHPGQGKGWGEERSHMHRRLWHALREIDLTDSQKTSIHQIRISLMKDMIQKRADLQIARLELREQLRKDAVDMAAVEAKVKKLAMMKTDIILNGIKAQEKIKASLTPEQRKKLAELMEKPHWGTDRMGPKG